MSFTATTWQREGAALPWGDKTGWGRSEWFSRGETRADNEGPCAQLQSWTFLPAALGEMGQEESRWSNQGASMDLFSAQKLI